MSNVLRGRGMTWALALWSAYIVTWTLVTEPGLGHGAAWWLAGIACVALLRPTSRIAAPDDAAVPVGAPDATGLMPDAAAGGGPTAAWPGSQ
jgi:hypothetical protein